MADRGRGSRFVRTDCLDCSEAPAAPDTSRDAHRVWAQRHADRTGHTVLVETAATRSYKPRNMRPTVADEPTTEIAPPDSHRFVYNVIGYCCSACRWTQRFGTPEAARLAHAEAHMPPAATEEADRG